MKLELASHTDARGGKKYNLDLSRRRSENVFKYLTGRGIDGSRLQVQGYGETQIRNQCKDGVACSEGEHQMNRRTEIKILEVGGVDMGQPVVDASDDIFSAETVALNEGTGEGKGGQDIAATEAPPKKKATTPTPEKESTNTLTERNRTSAYTVIAGTFANHDNAIRRAKHLNTLGYFESSIVRQSRSGLYAVYVNTFKQKGEAFALVKKLAQDQLHSYVLRQ
jgi:cell division septation protein DedD